MVKMVDAGKAVVCAAVVALVQYQSSWAATCCSWVVSAVSWCVRGLPWAYMVGRCLDEIDWHYHDSHLIFILLMLGLTVPACWYIPLGAATCGWLALAYDFYVHDSAAGWRGDEFVDECFATDLRRWVSLRRERGLSVGEGAVVGVVAGAVLVVPAAYPSSWAAAYKSCAGFVANWCVRGFPTFYVVGRGLDEIVYTYDLAEDLPYKIFLLSIFGLTVPACWYIPRCAVTCGALALAYDYYFHGLCDVDSRTEECFATDIRRWVSLRRERGLSNREVAVAGVALCLVAFAAGYWVVVTVETARGIRVAALIAGGAPRAAWAWEWLRYGARCIFGLMGTVGYWGLGVNGLAAHVRAEWRVAVFAGGLALLAALWFHAWHLVVGFAWIVMAYVGVYDESVENRIWSGRTRRVGKLFLVLALVMEPGAVAAAARAEYLGENDALSPFGLAEMLDRPRGLLPYTWRRYSVRAALVAWGFHGSVGRIRHPKMNAWCTDAGCALAIYFGGQALMQPGALFYIFGQYAACRALFGGIVLNASKRFFFGAGTRNGASRTSDAKGSSLTTTRGYVVGLVLLAAVFAWYERGQFETLNKKGLAIALSLQCASNCFMFHCIFTGYWAIFDKLLSERQAWFRACATLCVMYADTFYTDGQVTVLVQSFGGGLLFWRGLGMLTGAPHEAEGKAEGKTAWWWLAGAVRDGIGAVVNRALDCVNRARDGARGRADDQARRAADEAAAELLRDEERRERPGPRRRHAAAKPEPEPESDSDSEQDSDDDEGEPVDMEEFSRWRVATSLLQHAILNARFHGVVTPVSPEGWRARMLTMPMEVRDSLRRPLGFSEDQVSECLEYVRSLPHKDFRRILEFAEKQADEMAGQMPEFTDPSRDDGGSFQRASEEKLRTRRVVKVADRFRSAEAEAGARAKVKAIAAEAEAKAAETDRLRREAADSFALPDPAARTQPSKRELAARKSKAREKEKEEKLRAKRKQAEERRRKLAEWEAAKREEAARAEAEREPSPDADEAETASEASVEAKAKAADQAAAELLAAEEATAAAAAAKKKKKKRRGKRSGAAPIPAVEAPPAEAVAEPTVEQHDELSFEVRWLLRRLGLKERVGPVFAREQIDENALPFLTVEDLVEAGVATDDARKIVSTVEFEARRAAGTALVAVPDAEPAAEPADTAAEEPATAAEDTPSPESKQIPERLCCPISLELMERPVIAADGHTYDRSSIEDWLARGNTTSPTTGAPLEHLHLADNHLVRSMVSEYQDSLTSR